MSDFPYGQAPTLQPFQAPSIAQPNRFNPMDLDAVFNTAIQARLAKSTIEARQKEQDRADLEQNLNILSQGIDPTALKAPGGFTQAAQGFQAGFNGSPAVSPGMPGQTQTPGNPGIASPQQGMINQGFSSPGYNPGQFGSNLPPGIPNDTSHDLHPANPSNQNNPLYNSFMQLGMQKRASAVLGINKTKSDIDKTNAETNKLQSESDLNSGWQKLLGGNLDSNVWASSLRRDVASGKLAPSQAQAEASRLGPSGMGRMIVDSALAGLPLAKLEAQYQANIKRGTSQASVQGEQGQTMGTALGTLEDTLNKMEPLINKMGPSSFKLLNDAWSKGLTSVNDPDAQAALTLAGEAKGLYATVVANGGAAQKEDKQTAQDSIGRGLTPDSFAAMKDAVLFTGKSKISRLQGQGFGQPGPYAGAKQVTLKSTGERVWVKPDGKGNYVEVK